MTTLISLVSSNDPFRDRMKNNDPNNDSWGTPGSPLSPRWLASISTDKLDSAFQIKTHNSFNSSAKSKFIQVAQKYVMIKGIKQFLKLRKTSLSGWISVNLTSHELIDCCICVSAWHLCSKYKLWRTQQISCSTRILSWCLQKFFHYFTLKIKPNRLIWLKSSGDCLSPIVGNRAQDLGTWKSSTRCVVGTLWTSASPEVRGSASAEKSLPITVQTKKKCTSS